MKRLLSAFCLVLLTVLLVAGKGGYSKNLAKITMIQRQQIATVSRELRKEADMNKSKVILVFLLYGIVHSLGPGHGKSIISGIFLSDDRKIAQIGLFSGIICYSQGLTAFLMVKAFSILGKNLLPQEAFKTEEGLRIFSAGMILIIGSVMLYKKIFTEHTHSHGESKISLSTAVLLGLTPCFGTVNMLLFLGAMGLADFQLMGTLAISTGMFITVSSIGFITTTFKSLGKGAGSSYIKFLELIGPVIMVIYSLSVIKNGIS